MKSSALAILLTAATAFSAQAQSVSGSGWSSSSGYGINSGYGSGYSRWGTSTGYGGGYGYGYGRPGWCGGGVQRPGWRYGGYGWGLPYYGSSSYYSSVDGSYDYYSGPVYPNTSIAGPAPVPAPAGVSDRLPELAASRGIEEGKRRFRAAEYRGAVDEFRSAVASTPDDPMAQAWFAIGLAVLGDGRNADKAIRAAAGKFAPARISIADQFRDDKERVRVIVMLAKVDKEGALASAFALSRAGEPVRLSQLAAQDAAAQKLLVAP